jgi:xanthine dehydrogenase YagS FAD-binding subunit
LAVGERRGGAGDRSGLEEGHQANVVLGAVAPIPWRSREAEQALAGAVLDRARAAGAADAALKDARPLPHNAYKVAIARVLVQRAVLRAGQVQDVLL